MIKVKTHWCVETHWLFVGHHTTCELCAHVILVCTHKTALIHLAVHHTHVAFLLYQFNLLANLIQGVISYTVVWSWDYGVILF